MLKKKISNIKRKLNDFDRFNYKKISSMKIKDFQAFKKLNKKKIFNKKEPLMNNKELNKKPIENNNKHNRKSFCQSYYIKFLHIQCSISENYLQSHHSLIY